MDIDLTRGQFAVEEIVTSAVIIKRPSTISRLREEHELLRSRVFVALGLDEEDSSGGTPKIA